ncbi:MAG: hypothetical protein ABSD97_11490 [Acidimicrobiales bacterium]|jgi:hypothetical protein
MSDETGDERLEDFEFDLEFDPAASDAGGEELPGVEEIRGDLLTAIEEMGLGAGAQAPGGSTAGCYLSTVAVDLGGHGGVVVRWQLRDLPVPGEPAPLRESESVDILNEALGPLLLALGFPTEPYAVDGRWVVTGPRSEI